jgi:hypothetical protein
MNCRDFPTRGVKAILVLTFFSSILLGSCKTQEVKTYWSAEPVQIDGEMTEWVGKPTIYYEETGVQLGLRNDNQNLYILFRFNNQEWARLIRMGGVTLWLDNSGKKKKDFGIRYAGGPSLLDMRKSGVEGVGGFWDNLTPEQQERLMQRQESMAEQLIVIYNKSNQEIPIPANGSSGPAVSFDFPQGIYTYKFKIPLQKSEVFDYAIGAQPGQEISLGLEWGELKMGDREKRMKQMGEGGMRPPGGGMGGRPPGGGGPPGGGRSGPGMKKPEKQEIWIKTKLALPPTE